jgi:hypothetical protein
MANVIKLKGEPIQEEQHAAGEELTPGQLLTINTAGAWIKHATAGGPVPCTIAHEREEMGKTIDDTYAVGDYVKAATYAAGMRFLGWIASGQNLQDGSIVESAGNGTFRVYASGTPLARCLEDTGAVVVSTRVRFEKT